MRGSVGVSISCLSKQSFDQQVKAFGETKLMLHSWVSPQQITFCLPDPFSHQGSPANTTTNK